jgi:hypothetical protein
MRVFVARNGSWRWLLSFAGLLLIVGGLTGGVPTLLAIVYEAQGKCDYLPCVGPTTWPSLVGFSLQVVVGAILAAWSIFGRNRVRAQSV